MKLPKLGLAALLLWAAAAHADFPDKPIKLVIPLGTGSIDPAVRVITTGMSDYLKVPIIVENMPGASGSIGTGRVAKSPPDGYTLLLGSEPMLVHNPFFYKLPYDPAKELVPVSQAFSTGLVLLVSRSLGVKTLQELIALAKANPGKLTYGTLGKGSSGHVAGELLKKAAGIDILHIPYKTSAPQLSDLLAGRISMVFYLHATVEGHIKAGNMVPLAYTGRSRLPGVPELPTFAESGLPGFSYTLWFGFFAPAGTPKDVIAKLNASVHHGIRTQEAALKKYYEYVPDPGTPDQLADAIREGTERFRKQLTELDLQPE